MSALAARPTAKQISHIIAEQRKEKVAGYRPAHEHRFQI
jgi:hypothetical protein